MELLRKEKKTDNDNTAVMADKKVYTVITQSSLQESAVSIILFSETIRQYDSTSVRQALESSAIPVSDYSLWIGGVFRDNT